MYIDICIYVYISIHIVTNNDICVYIYIYLFRYVYKHSLVRLDSTAGSQAFGAFWALPKTDPALCLADRDPSPVQAAWVLLVRTCFNADPVGQSCMEQLERLPVQFLKV